MTPPDETQADRVLVRPPNWLGDAVLALPAIAAIRRHFPSAALTIAAPPAVAAIFREDTPARPDAVIDLPSSSRAQIAAVAAIGAQVGILFPNSFGSAWMLRRAKVSQRWGYARSARGWLLSRRAQKTKAHGVQHQADYYRALVRGLGIPCDDEAPSMRVSEAGKSSATALLRSVGITSGTRIVALAPGAAYGQAKQWPPDRVAAVAARLVADRGVACVIVGAGHDRAASRAVESWLLSHAPEAVSRVRDLVGRTSVNALVGVLAVSDVLVTNDSGAMHVAAALGRPVVAMFGPTDARATRPLGRHAILSADVFCRPCLLRDCPIDYRCMTRISTDTVFAAVSSQLAFEKRGA